MKTEVAMAVLVTALGLTAGCASQLRQERVRRTSPEASLVLAEENPLPEMAVPENPHRDTLVVDDPEGNRVMIMRAVKDENGEMVATDVLDAAMVTARFRNVAERGGVVDLGFRIIVPGEMQDSHWQLRFYPSLRVGADSLDMDPVLITGALYRKAQLKGYQQYQRFLDSIVADSTHFVDRYQLEMFLQRNIPELYRFRSDSSDVSDHEFASAYGVTQQQALEHYTNQLVVRRNRRKVQRKEAMFHRLVKVPILTEGLRLDTVIQDAGGDIIYDYVQTIQVRPGVRKAVVTLRGQIFEEDKAVYRIPAGDPLTFYISSLSTLCDGAVRYKTKVIERRVEAHTACYIAFAQGKSDIRPGEGNNAEEMGRIRRNLASLAENREFDLDSIVVTASCSPEGSFIANRILSRKRSESVSAYFEAYLKQYRDSLERERGAVVDLDGEAVEKPTPIRFLSYENPENWEMLDRLVETDTLLSEAARSSYRSLAGKRDPDQRERALQGQPFYRHLREALYPRLRTVKFDFHLHRKGMVKDTVHTTVVDSVYMDGLAALRDHDYQRAVTLLRPYRDYNSAVAYCSLGYNASALDILERLAPTDRVLYLLSILYSRTGEDRKAVECYMKACRENPSYVHRGNLDPEISALIKHYGLNTN